MEAAESLALVVSGAMALAWESPIAEIVKAKKTCKQSLNHNFKTTTITRPE